MPNNVTFFVLFPVFLLLKFQAIWAFISNDLCREKLVKRHFLDDGRGSTAWVVPERFHIISPRCGPLRNKLKQVFLSESRCSSSWSIYRTMHFCRSEFIKSRQKWKHTLCNKTFIIPITLRKNSETKEYLKELHQKNVKQCKTKTTIVISVFICFFNFCGLCIGEAHKILCVTRRQKIGNHRKSW